MKIVKWQLLIIEYFYKEVLRSYTPDFLVYYRKDIQPANKYGALLCEVKYEAELKEDKNNNKAKFQAKSEFELEKMGVLKY